MCYMRAMEYYSVLKRKEILTAPYGMGGPEGLLRTISQSRKDELCVIPLV